MRTRSAPLVGVVLVALLGGPALADEPAAPPAEKPPAPAPAADAKKKEKAPEPAPLPPPAVRFWMAAPSPTGLWTLRIDNEGEKALRIPADVRLLRFEIDPVPAPPAADAKPATKKPKPLKPIVCQVPSPLRPDGYPDKSALLLGAGESYVESFDPRLFCFGTDTAAALRGASVVRTHFGWTAAPASKWKKPAPTPFAAEGTAFPAEVAALPGLDAPTMVLSYEKAVPPPPSVATNPAPIDPRAPRPPRPDGPKRPKNASDKPRPPTEAPPPADGDDAPDAPPPPPPPRPAPVDENAPRLELSAPAFIDASSSSRAAITLTATNAGHRPMLVALHNRMVAMRVEGPNGAYRCDAMPPTRAIPRELFRTLKPGQSSSMTLLIAETCPRDAMRRPGLYKITATLFANESGAELGLAAFTGAGWLKTPSLVRVLSAPEPFYAGPPKALPTPRPKPPADDTDDDATTE